MGHIYDLASVELFRLRVISERLKRSAVYNEPLERRTLISPTISLKLNCPLMQSEKAQICLFLEILLPERLSG